jgi:hypothetical protein
MMNYIFPQQPCPQTSKLKSIDEVDLDNVPLGTIIEFQGIHPESIYSMQIVEKEGRSYVDLWFKGRPGCFRSLTSEWKNDKYNLAVKVGSGYIVPHFYYNQNGLTERGLLQPRAERFRRIMIEEK